MVGDDIVKHIFSSVDIGSDTIKVVVCELYKGKLNLLAASSVKSKGIKKGLITDFEAASVSMRKAITEVEGMLGIKIKKVIISVPSYFADFLVVKGETKVTGEEHIVTGDDIIEVLQNAMKDKLMPGKEMVTMLPIDFKLDDKEGIKDPKGLVGNTLSARAVMATTPKKNIYSVVSLMDNIGIEIVDISLNPIGNSYAFRSKEMDAQVGAIVDVGAETTTVALYNKGIIVKSSIIAMGSRNIDNDLAYIYKVDLNQARKIKEKFALAHKKYASTSETYEVKMEEETIRINQFETSEIVMSRIEEILTLARKEINILTNRKVDYVIVTGGTSNMAHFDYIAEDIFGKDVIIGDVKLVGIRHNKFSACVGNIVYFINKLKLKGKNFTMISSSDMEELETPKKGIINNISNESMLGKVFGYFFGE
ncbi:MAG: cell division protein FtsA [Firmicutes bacterium]|nr:cell division protein FtsA [Bacillota bacterium]